MIKRLRIKFVCINMTIVTVMLCAILGLVLHFTGANMERESLDMMHSVALQTAPPGPPGKIPFGKNTPGFWQPCFTLHLGANGTVTAYGGDYFDLSDEVLIQELLTHTSDQKTGVLKEYGLRFIRIETPMEQRIVFADISSEISTMNNLFQSCLLIGVLSFVIFLIVSIRLAQWAVKPVETAWEQQRQFVADASHELKTPLTVILSNAQMLAGNGEDPQLREKLTGNILTVSQQMKDLVAKLLNCAQVDQGVGAISLSPTNLSAAVSGAVLPFDSIFYEQGKQLDCEIQEGIWVQGSQSHLVQVVDILLDNAQKYGSQGGRTQISLERHGTRNCLLTVSNEGTSMSSRELKDIFKRFYRADSARERTGSYGLGLSIAEGIVTAHRGKIWAESRDGINTFFVQLPFTTEKA